MRNVLSSRLLGLALALALLLPALPSAAALEIGDILGGDSSCPHKFGTTWLWVWSGEPGKCSCTENSYSYYTCELCGAREINGIMYATGHKYQNGVCTVCGEADPSASSGGASADSGSTVNPGEPETGETPSASPGESGKPSGGCANGQHKWQLEITAPTCAKEGKAVQVCSVCGEEVVQNTFPKAEHTWAQRSGYRICTVCGEREETQDETPQTPSQPSQTAPSAGAAHSGSTSMSKLSQQEITKLLADAPHTSASGDLFDVQPSCSAPYSPGKVKTSALQAAVNRLNALRRIAGLPSVSLDQALCDNAQYGAVILGALGDLDHRPSKPADMDQSFYQKAYSATSSSNLSAGSSLTGAVDSFMHDSDGSNIDRAGHRRWQLNPTLGKVGFGYVSSGRGYGRFVAEKVFDQSGSGCPYHFISWPASGSFPTELFESDQAWTVTLNPQEYAAPKASAITVTLSGGGKSWTFQGSQRYSPASSGKYFNVDTAGYGVSNCIIFRPDGVSSYSGAYTVKIDGLQAKNGSAASLEFQVDFFGGSSSAQQPQQNPQNQQNQQGNQQGQQSQQNQQGQQDQQNQQNQQPGAAGKGENPFTDVASGTYYYDAVLWALKNNITTGVTATEFRPNSTCTRGQVVTFLWRAKGCPEPRTKTNPFRDVSPSSPFYKAILWAQENGVTTGTTATTFNPGGTCTSGHVVTFLWRANGKPASTGGASLADNYPGSYFTDALAWADTNGLLDGTGSGFVPSSQSPRANIVTYLYRDSANR